MVDSFFSRPKKRSSSGRTKTVSRGGGKRREGDDGGKRQRHTTKSKRNNDDDDEITSESEASGGEGQEMEVDHPNESEEEDGFFDNETEVDKRRRLAQDYLDNVTQELTLDGFDAADLDRDIIASRLKEDVAEHKGRVYRYLADKLDLSNVSKDNKTARMHLMKPYGVTAVAAHYPHVYTVSKDLYLTKWDVSKLKAPRQVKYVRGNRHKKGTAAGYEGHTDEILCCAVSPDGKYVATGGKDRQIIVWSGENLSFIRAFDTKDKRGVVMGLVFRRGTNELYASCADLKVRTYDVGQMAQKEVLFGHQDSVCDIDAMGQERCLTVGSRDRTAIMWKIAEESRLTFRGGSRPKDGGTPLEGSIDCCSMIDDQLFVTGSDNGSISLWSLHKKKPVYTVTATHGRDGESGLPRYITAIYAIPYSDTFFTGSWDETINMWKLSPDHRSFELIGQVPCFKGVVNRITHVEYGPRNHEQVCLYAAVSKEMRLGRWLKLNKGKNGLFSAIISPKAA